MEKGIRAEVELRPRCSYCEGILEHASCTECHKLLMQSSMKGDAIYCFGPKGENWHMCERCTAYLEDLKCPKCEGKQISRYAKDTEFGVIIVNTCLKTGCHSTWETKRGTK